MKKIIYLLTLCISFSINANEIPTGNATLHMIIFAATDDASIGKSCDIDYTNIKSLAYDISKGTGMLLEKHYYKASTNRKKQMQSVLENLTVGSNDVVYFYYSGHGYRTSNSPSGYPRMGITNNGIFKQEDQGISVEYVREKIKKAKPRLAIIMVDACNTKINIKEPTSGLSGATSYSRQLKRLFLESKGEVVICGSKAGDGNDNSGSYTGYSWSNSREGGFFTLSFRKEFFKSLKSSSPANWDDLLAKTKSSTISLSKQRLRKEVSGNNVQIPVYKYLKNQYR